MLTTTRNWNLNIAQHLSNRALHAYDTPEQIKAAGRIPILNTKFDLQAVVEFCETCTLLSFRGTRSRENWKIDLNGLPNRAGIHSGFAEGFAAINPSILDVIPNRECHRGTRTKPLYVDGHSLGGGLGVLAAEYYEADLCYTFGQPRVFTRSYIKRNQDRLSRINLWRVEDKEDIVSHAPGLLLGYGHFGQLGLISSYGDFEINPPVWRQTSSHIKGISADLFRVFNGHMPEWVMIKEHSMDLYVSALGNLAHRTQLVFNGGG